MCNYLSNSRSHGFLSLLPTLSPNLTEIIQILEILTKFVARRKLFESGGQQNFVQIRPYQPHLPQSPLTPSNFPQSGEKLNKIGCQWLIINRISYQQSYCMSGFAFGMETMRRQNL